MIDRFFARFDLAFYPKINKLSKFEKFINFSFKRIHSSFFRPHLYALSSIDNILQAGSRKD